MFKNLELNFMTWIQICISNANPDLDLGTPKMRIQCGFGSKTLIQASYFVGFVTYLMFKANYE